MVVAEADDEAIRIATPAWEKYRWNLAAPRRLEAERRRLTQFMTSKDGSFGFVGDRPAGLPSRETRRDIEAELERFDQQKSRPHPNRLGGALRRRSDASLRDGRAGSRAAGNPDTAVGGFYHWRLTIGVGPPAAYRGAVITITREESPMHLSTLVALSLAVSVVFGVTAASAQAPPPPYGAPISLDQAKKAMAAAEAEAKKNNWPVVIAILDSGGNIVMLQRLDNTQFGSVEVARSKAHTAVAFRRPTKVFQDLVEKGGANLRLLKLEGASVLEGGVPIIVEGKIIGGIGVSGVTSQQDAQVATAGASAVK